MLDSFGGGEGEVKEIAVSQLSSALIFIRCSES